MNVMYFSTSPIARHASGSSVVHVQFVGQHFDVPLSRLDMGDELRDRRIRLAVARYLSLPDGALDAYAIDRHTDGNLTIRPGSA